MLPALCVVVVLLLAGTAAFAVERALLKRREQRRLMDVLRVSFFAQQRMQRMAEEAVTQMLETVRHYRQ